VKTCSRCQIVNPDESVICDCGFDLANGQGSARRGPTAKRVIVILVALAVAGAMGALGALLTPFRPQELILPSIITWSILLPVITRGGVGRAALIGSLSPFLGAVVAVVVNQGVAEVHVRTGGDQLGVIAYALGYALVTWWISIPLGLVTGVALWWVVARNSPGPRREA